MFLIHNHSCMIYLWILFFPPQSFTKFLAFSASSFIFGHHYKAQLIFQPLPPITSRPLFTIQKWQKTSTSSLLLTNAWHSRNGSVMLFNIDFKSVCVSQSVTDKPLSDWATVAVVTQMVLSIFKTWKHESAS